MIKFNCSKCEKKIGVPPAYAGKLVKCPRCKQPARVPERELEPVEEQVADSIWTDDLLGTTEPSESAPDFDLNPQAAAPTPGSSIPATPPAAVPAKPAEPRCPKCSTVVPSGSEFCITCGHRVQSFPAAESGTSNVVKSAAKIPLALGGGFVGAMIGAFAWGILAYLTKREFGIIAIGVGGLAGFGLTVFTERRGVLMGLLAIAFAFVGIMTGKFLVAKWVVLPILREFAEEEDIFNLELTEVEVVEIISDQEQMFSYACQELADQGYWDDMFSDDPEGLYKERFVSRVQSIGSGMNPKFLNIPQTEMPRIQNAVQEVRQAMRSWTLEEKKTCIRTQHQKDIQDMKEFTDELGHALKEGDENSEEEPSEIAKETGEVLTGERSIADTKIGFFLAFLGSFGFWDLLFFPLAFVTAYKIGSGSAD